MIVVSQGSAVAVIAVADEAVNEVKRCSVETCAVRWGDGAYLCHAWVRWMGVWMPGVADGAKAKWILYFDPFGQSREATVLCGAKCGKRDGMGLFEY